MTTHASGTVETKHWEEKTWDGKLWNEVSGAKLTHAKVTAAFHGDIEGDSTQAYLMAYRSDTWVSFVGLEQVTGRIGDRSGSFVLQHNGIFDSGRVESHWQVVPGSATGDLRGLRGKGTYIFDGQHGDPTRFTFDYDFEAA